MNAISWIRLAVVAVVGILLQVSVFDDIDVLAERYHWSERAILSLPLTRRTQYVERARQALTT